MSVLTRAEHEASFEEQTVGAVVAANYRAADVFTRHGIDYCCGGDKTIAAACKGRGLTPRTLMAEIASIVEEGGSSHAYNEWALDFLADYIVNEHHAYTRRMLPRLTGLMDGVVAAHGESHPEVHEIQRTLQAVVGELVMHIQKEELMLFPYIKRLVRGRQAGEQIEPPKFGAAVHLIREMEEEHDATGGALAALSELTDGFTPPVDACNTFRALYAYLDEFQAKTKEHVHLENNILFPKAIVLEKQQVAW